MPQKLRHWPNIWTIWEIIRNLLWFDMVKHLKKVANNKHSVSDRQKRAIMKSLSCINSLSRNDNVCQMTIIYKPKQSNKQFWSIHTHKLVWVSLILPFSCLVYSPMSIFDIPSVYAEYLPFVAITCSVALLTAPVLDYPFYIE